MDRYHVNRIIEELNRPFEDGSHIIYVNGNYKGHDKTAQRQKPADGQPHQEFISAGTHQKS
ncbi:hypothetical protein [Megasphaera massiliensis]|uniref:hypothetical protein n=1 Tax=Megasphaera massiliensis TaxID=1232428 RepID=UPI000425DE55|nr:hypothetical protein [uncultured Megasphaera sp.]MBS6255779.1 hypothetical protein [Megasphaera sp.]